MTGEVATRDGRALSYVEVGDADGPLVIHNPVEGAGHFIAVGAGDEVFAIAAEELGAP